MQPNYDHHPLKRLFSALVEHAFCVEVGVCDPRLTDYMIALLLDFVHVDRLHKYHDAGGRQVATVCDTLALLDPDRRVADLPEDRDVHRHIGDVTLFWSGVYPEYLQRNRRSINPDHLIDFVGQGKESYAIASELTDDGADPPPSLLRRLSSEFEVCAHGLGLVRRGWEQRGVGGPGDSDPDHLVY